MPCVFGGGEMERRLPVSKMRTYALLSGEYALFAAVYALQTYGIADLRDAFSQGKIHAVEGILHRIFRFHEQKSHLFDGVEP
jgi:hypothetical protein